jgi:hypothetical protein
VLVLLGLFGGGGWYLCDQSRGPLPPPDGPWPEQFGFTVSLCDKWSGGCTQAGNEAVKNPAASRQHCGPFQRSPHSDRSVTEPQKQAIIDRLWGIAGVEKIY